ncbi:MAG TPA: radical SAM protein, partial [Thermoanaerobaculia bacterium]|nr:radical SAM protein [Thermoanaerobaculia bacterium]
ESPGNRLYQHIKRCALEYHCFAAKNAFYVRHEAPVPLSAACTARCVGCISLQEDPTCEASHERITFLPRVDEIVELAANHLIAVPDGIVSFGQGCEGEPLMQWRLIGESIRRIRSITKNGSLHLNTNGYDPNAVEELAKAGLDSIRVSLNSFREDFYSPYYRPVTYELQNVVESIRRAKALGVYTSINYLIFPGITDQEGEVDALLGAIETTKLDLIQMKNLCIDPRMYLGILPPAESEPLGIRHVLRRVQRETGADLGYFNRPRSLWGQRFCQTLEF